jgi:hypothetical protein
VVPEYAVQTIYAYILHYHKTKKRDADKEMKKKKVKLVKLPRRNIDRLRLGMFGEILAYREGHVLVKWKGRTGPVSHKTSEVEVIVEKKQTL